MNKQQQDSHIVMPVAYLSEQEQQEFIGLARQNIPSGHTYCIHPVDASTDAVQLRTEMYPFYCFEENLFFWQTMFSQGEETPRSVQKVFLLDYTWKLQNGVLWPYHYTSGRQRQVKAKMHALLGYISDQLLLEQPGLDSFHRYYLLGLQTGKSTEVVVTPEQVQIRRDGRSIYKAQKFEVVLTKFKPAGNKLLFVAFIKSPVFNFCEAPTLWMEQNGDHDHLTEVPLKDSSWNYYKCKEETNHFYTFVLTIPTKKIKKFHFYVKIRDQLFDTYYYFMPEVVFDNSFKRYRYYDRNKVYRFDRNTFLIEKATAQQAQEYQSAMEKQLETDHMEMCAFRRRIQEKRQEQKRIWLYYDCKGVYKDNGYLQFVHDFGQQDGVEKYYILNNDLETCRELFTPEQLPYVVAFGSEQHKLLYCVAEQVITAYIEKNNYLPFTDFEYSCVMDVATMPLITYLQHGVYHAFIPWKYSLDRLQVDLKVISSPVEREQDLTTHCFTRKQELAACMPRYDFIDHRAKPAKRILYAPSWRKYLVGMENHTWITREDLFVQSRFYQETSRFLQDTKLIAYMKRHGYTLDFKLHPILMRYAHLYAVDGEVVRMASDSVKEEEYAIFITDFSSYVFDFAYLGRSILYFLADYDEFRSGMSDYRQCVLPFRGGIGAYADRAQDAAKCLRRMIRRQGKPKRRYRKKMEKLFYHRDDKARQRIYQRLIGKK